MHELRLKSKQRPISQNDSKLKLIDYSSQMKKWRQFNEYQKITNNYDWQVNNVSDFRNINLIDAQNNFQKDYKTPNYKGAIIPNNDNTLDTSV